MHAADPRLAGTSLVDFKAPTTAGLIKGRKWNELNRIDRSGGRIRAPMLASPPDVDCDGMVDTMRSAKGVRDVYHVQLWQMPEHETALDCEVVLTSEKRSWIEDIEGEIKGQLRSRFGISHTSLEFHHEDRAHENAALCGRDGVAGKGEA